MLRVKLSPQTLSGDPADSAHCHGHSVILLDVLLSNNGQKLKSIRVYPRQIIIVVMTLGFNLWLHHHLPKHPQKLEPFSSFDRPNMMSQRVNWCSKHRAKYSASVFWMTWFQTWNPERWFDKWRNESRTPGLFHQPGASQFRILTCLCWQPSFPDLIKRYANSPQTTLPTHTHHHHHAVKDHQWWRCPHRQHLSPLFTQSIPL